MADLDKVLKGLECCKNGFVCGDDCPYRNVCFNGEEYAFTRLASDALELLKAERKEGHWEVFTICSNEGTYCSECHTKIFDFVTPPKRKLSMFCPHCGVKMSKERIIR